jgi:hypothetical protein
MPIVERKVVPEDLSGVGFLDVESISINEWYPDSKAEMPPEQVHIVLDVKQLPFPIVLRLKTKAVADSISGALNEHIKNVWG